jgi:DNA-binding XRE family transcriptional regulator
MKYYFPFMLYEYFLYICSNISAYYIKNMANKEINRLRVVLAEKGITNKWLAERMGKNQTTVSRWCNNEMQPSLETLVQVASVLKVDVRDLLTPTLDKNG